MPPGMRVLVCTARQDMRKSFDTLAAVVSAHLGESPQSGTLYVFFGRGGRRVKVLWWDANGYACWRSGCIERFSWCPAAAKH